MGLWGDDGIPYDYGDNEDEIYSSGTYRLDSAEAVWNGQEFELEYDIDEVFASIATMG